APRLGFIFDPTSEGKAKIFGHWGRFYENVPMDLNVRAFGGETFNDSRVNLGRIAMGDPGYDPNCKVDHGTPNLNAALDSCTDRGSVRLLGDGTAFISPGLKGQFTQELIFGAEFEIRNDLKLGINYIHRSLPQVIEDVSPDGGNNYVITNPSENFDGEATKLDALAVRTRDAAGCMSFADDSAGCDQDQLALANLQKSRAGQLRGIKNFDKPVRNYDAVQLQATQNPTKHSLLIASYTFSQSKGNYPGLFSTETGQLDANITSMYDLPDLMANRYGKLGLDRPHNLKIDGFYMFDLKKSGTLTAGASFRAQSGLAHNALAAHPIYGESESYLLPRGAIERSPLTSQTDVHLSYGYQVNKTTKVEGFVNFFNLFNQQEELNVDENYTIDPANPVVNGTQSDLAHVKAIDDSGYELNRSVIKNKNFNNTGVTNTLLGSPLQAPRNVQIGFRVTF
ncbi:MAG: hypothetical protein NT062_06120, partial [Proteobacteria bacterium]|nr:hypothetical protein [Pseudomonadota bacterium]